MPHELLRPAWPTDHHIGAAMATRAGGVSAGPYRSLNLGTAVGDDADAVRENRRRFAAALGATPVYLRQVHGAAVVRLRARDLERSDAIEADAAVTTEPGIACTVQVADCLPVLLAARGARGVAAAHVGWRGLAAGVIDASVLALCEAAGCAPTDLLAWLGPCIGPRRFEVGADVLAAFGASADKCDPQRFVARPRPDGSARWLADLPRLARDRLEALGVTQIDNDSRCTVDDDSRFFSFRRDGVTGRHAAAVWLRS